MLSFMRMLLFTRGWELTENILLRVLPALISACKLVEAGWRRGLIYQRGGGFVSVSELRITMIQGIFPASEAGDVLVCSGAFFSYILC